VQELIQLLQYNKNKIKATELKKNKLVDMWKDLLQKRVDAPTMEGWSVEKEEVLNKLMNEKVTVEGVALAGHQSLSARQIGNIIKNMSK
jgi:hypothetical protein